MFPRSRSTRRLKFLTQREATILQAIAETFFPAGDNGMPHIDEAEVVEYMDDLLLHLPLREGFLIRGLVNLLELQSFVFAGASRQAFSKAPTEVRTANLAGWETSRLPQRRMVFAAIRTLLLWAYADSQSMEGTLGIGSTQSQPPPIVLYPTIARRVDHVPGIAAELAPTGSD